MKYLFLIVLLLTGCGTVEPPIVIKLVRRDGTEVLCKTSKEWAECKPWRVFLSCTGSGTYDCDLELGTIQ